MLALRSDNNAQNIVGAIINNTNDVVEQTVNNVKSIASGIFHDVHYVVKFGIDNMRDNIKNAFNVAHHIHGNVQDTIAHIISNINILQRIIKQLLSYYIKKIK